MQSGTLYEKIPDLPKTTAPSGSHAADGMIGSVSIKSKKKSSKNSSPTITLPYSPKGDSSTEVSVDVHVVDSSTTNSDSKENGKNTNNQNSKDKTNKNESTDEKRKTSLSVFHLRQGSFYQRMPISSKVFKIR